MLSAILIILITLLVFLSAFLSNNSNLFDKRRKGLRIITRIGWWIFGINIVIIGLSLGQYQLSQIESNQKDSIMLRAYTKSVEKIREDQYKSNLQLKNSYDTSTLALKKKYDTTTSNIINALAVYGLKYDVTTRTIENISKKNSEIQDKIYDETIGSKSFPYLTLDVNDQPKADQVEEGGWVPVTRLIVNVTNLGKYSVKSIEVSYDQYRIHYESTHALFEINNLLAGTTLTKEINLTSLNVIHVDGITFEFKVKWKLEYTCIFRLDVTMPSPDGITGYQNTAYYYMFKGKRYDSGEALQKAILKVLP